MASLEGWNYPIKLCPNRTLNSTVPSDERLVKALALSQSRHHGGVLTFKRARDQGGVMAAKAEGIIEYDAHLLFASNVSRVIEVAFFARIFQVDGWRNYRVADGQCAGGHLYSTGAAQQVTGHRFRRTDRNLVRICAKDLLDGPGFANIADVGGSSVRVDVIDLRR